MPRDPESTPTPRRPRSLFERNYRRLEEIIGRPLPDLQSGIVYRLRAENFMDLVVEVLPPCPETGAQVLSLAHYFLQNGDLCQDPEMEVRVFPPRDGHPGRLEALTFMQANPPIYSRVYPEPGMMVPRLKRELNAFLGVWLRNLKAQGHRLVPERA
ncbi:MAG TPA: DUF1249 domain-containing protein [Thermoanaerobaculia bacterium]|nr:DUF1249 domain-containing protein [Thermoanaerobaculia bacterium]